MELNSRRKAMKAVVGFFGCMLSTIMNKCVALAETTRFYWPGHWSERALKNHLINDPKHGFSSSKVNSLSFQGAINLHDNHHRQLGNRAPFPGGKTVPGSGGSRSSNSRKRRKR